MMFPAFTAFSNTGANIIIPEEFEVGFDHVTNLIAGLGMEDDPNYYLTRGYPGSVNTYVFNSISEPANNSYPPTNEETFIGYMHLSRFGAKGFCSSFLFLIKTASGIGMV